MNYRMLVYVMGRILRAEGLLMIFPFIISLVYGEKSGFAFAVALQQSALHGFYSLFSDVCLFI